MFITNQSNQNINSNICIKYLLTVANADDAHITYNASHSLFNICFKIKANFTTATMTFMIINNNVLRSWLPFGN